jgi:hypothetical protein
MPIGLRIGLLLPADEAVETVENADNVAQRDALVAVAVSLIIYVLAQRKTNAHFVNR